MMLDDKDIRRYCVPFYLDFLHANFTRTDTPYSVVLPNLKNWEEWRLLLHQELETITPEIAGDLITDWDWRTQICGAYFIGLKRWDDFTLDLGRRLVTKNNMSATQGYAFALARMPSHASANYLCGYLSRIGHWTDTTDWYYVDLEWVVAALNYVDVQMGTHRSDEYMEKLIPIQQKRDYELSLKSYQTLLSHWPLVESQITDEAVLRSRYAAMKNQLENLENRLNTFYKPENPEQNLKWFENLMDFCATHFDSEA